MAYLYQDIMKVPGLSGNSYARQKQYWDKLGLGPGYRGTYDQNIRLLGQIKQPNYGIPQAAPAQPAQPATGPIQQAIDTGAGGTYQGPVFSETLPFYDAWGQMKPQAEQEAESIVNPFIERDLWKGRRNLDMQLASTGGGRFGRGVGQRGSLFAGAEQSRKAQILDWVNQRQQGFKSLFYDPTEEAWNNQATRLMQQPDAVTPPTFADYMKKYESGVKLGGGGQANTTNPWAGTAQRYWDMTPRFGQTRQPSLGDFGAQYGLKRGGDRGTPIQQTGPEWGNPYGKNLYGGNNNVYKTQPMGQNLYRTQPMTPSPYKTQPIY